MLDKRPIEPRSLLTEHFGLGPSLPVHQFCLTGLESGGLVSNSIRSVMEAISSHPAVDVNFYDAAR